MYPIIQVKLFERIQLTLILDTGSSISLIHKKLANKLQLRRHKCQVPHILSGLGKECEIIVSEYCYLTVAHNLTIRCYVVANICEDIYTVKPNDQLLKLLETKDVKLAQVLKEGFKQIDLLIGLDNLHKVFTEGQQYNINGIVCTPSIFGYILYGLQTTPGLNRVNFRNRLVMSVSNKILNETLKKFWELESMEIFYDNKGLTEKEKLSIKTFEENVRLFAFDFDTQQVFKNMDFLKKQPVLSEVDLNKIAIGDYQSWKSQYIFEVSLNFVEKPEVPQDFPITFERAQALFRKLRHPSKKEMMETYYDKIQELIKKGYIFQLGTLPDVDNSIRIKN